MKTRIIAEAPIPEEVRRNLEGFAIEEQIKSFALVRCHRTTWWVDAREVKDPKNGKGNEIPITDEDTLLVQDGIIVGIDIGEPLYCFGKNYSSIRSYNGHRTDAEFGYEEEHEWFVFRYLGYFSPILDSWHMEGTLAEIRMEALEALRQMDEGEEKNIYTAWEFVCRLEYQCEREGVLSLEELTPVPKESKDALLALLAEAVRMLTDASEPDLITELLTNYYYIANLQGSDRAVCYLYLECVRDIRINRTALRESGSISVREFLYKQIAILPENLWKKCMRIAELSDEERIRSYTLVAQPESGGEREEHNQVYRWFASTRKQVFPQASSVPGIRERSWNRFADKLRMLSNAGYYDGIKGLTEAGRRLEKYSTGVLYFLGKACGDEKKLLYGTFVLDMIREFEELRGKNIAEDLERYICIRGLFLIMSGAKEREVTALVNSMIPRGRA